MILVLATFPDASSAKAAARTIIQKRLAACAYVSAPGTSIYWWDERVCEESEVQLWLKAPKAAWEPLKAEILSLHPFDVPQILSMNMDNVHLPYKEWALKVTKNEPINSKP